MVNPLFLRHTGCHSLLSLPKGSHRVLPGFWLSVFLAPRALVGCSHLKHPRQAHVSPGLEPVTVGLGCSSWHLPGGTEDQPTLLIPPQPHCNPLSGNLLDCVALSFRGNKLGDALMPGGGLGLLKGQELHCDPGKGAASSES